MNGLFPSLPLADTLLGTLAIRHRVLDNKKDDDEDEDVDDDMVVTFVFGTQLINRLHNKWIGLEKAFPQDKKKLLAPPPLQSKTMPLQLQNASAHLKALPIGQSISGKRKFVKNF